jgi:hypothetical protein
LIIVSVWTDEETVAAGRNGDPARWREGFEVTMGRIAGRFARVEPRLRAGRLVLGLLSDLPRKNCWTIAKWAGEAGPHGMQHLLYRALLGRRCCPRLRVFQDARVRFHGQPVAVVVATTLEAARHAASLVKIDYDA